MKKILKIFMLALIIPIAFVFVGCEDKVVSIADISKTDSVGVVDTYTITYTDGTTSNFTIVNGEDGSNLYNNITINQLYEQVKSNKPTGYSLTDFIDEYLDIQIDTSAVASSKALKSAVSIFVEHEITIQDYNNITGFSIFNEPIYGKRNSITMGAGAGVIYDLNKTTGDAYIVTNYHVCFAENVNAEDGIGTKFITYVYGSESFDLNDMEYLKYYNNNCKTYKDLFELDAEGLPIVDYGFGAIEAEFVGGSEQYDIAVLKITNSERLKNSACEAVEVLNSNLVTPGATSIAVGNPDASGIAVTSGVLSVDNEYISVKISDSAVVLREFRIDTPVNPGNSGGGLFDGFGRLIGIVNAKTSNDSIENMAYAIPSNIAIRVADRIIKQCDGEVCKINKVFMGITLEIVDSNNYYDDETGLLRIKEVVKISSTTSESLANNLGLKSGDILTSLEIINESGTKVIKVERLFDVIDAGLLINEGDCIKFNYTRAGVSGSLTTSALTSENFLKVD